MRKSLVITPVALLTGICILFTSCETGTTNNADDNGPVAHDSTDAKAGKVKNILYSIPSPMEMADIIRESGSQYDNKILNTTDNARKYSGDGKLAINLGIYGADLSYTSMFDQRQESMNYLAAAQKLSRGLGVDGALQDDLIDRLNSNQENRDSLLNIVSQAYADLNDYLRENNRDYISALVIAGGWVEGLYLATYYHGVTKNAALRQRIVDQKYSLNDLISLMESYGDQAVLQDVLKDLKEVQSLYNQSNASNSKTTTSKSADGTLVIGGAQSLTLSDETLSTLTKKINELRAKYTS